jgi:alpha-amylase/alpha-mannosidase (GH57 family)
MVRVALLWHMHQPSYRDPMDGSLVLPWVRLHALKDYWGMVELLREFPQVHLTLNLVPSLVDQIAAYASGEAHEPLQRLSMKPADELTADERVTALQAFFMAHERNVIGRFPRYSQLLEQRGASREETALRAAAVRFSHQDLLDLQLLSKLAWFDYDLCEKDPLLRHLIVKGAHFSEEDKLRLAEREQALIAAVLPAYRRAAESGQVELSTSPYYHPILPLLCDTETHHEACPGAPLPHRFKHPEDAADQIHRAVARHTAVFGIPPQGLWPSEGAVSDEVATIVARAGLRWMASDEGVLERSAGRPLHRDSRGTVHPLDLLYRPWVRNTSAGPLSILFRDRALSDLIGFSYSSLEPQAAAHDLLERLRRIGESWERHGLSGDPVVPIILDGENAWEYFREGGRVFLRALYAGLASDTSTLRATTMTEALDGAEAAVLPRVFAGSWIHADFNVWIGHADDRRAWDQLSYARDALDAAVGRVPDDAIERAREIFRAACGSDWCWWYGEDHTSETDIQFDLLYRRHLRAIYGTLGLPAPDALDEPLITTRSISVRHSRPTGTLAPVLDGCFTSPAEWIGAGVYRASAFGGGTMQRGVENIRVVRFGTGDDHLQLLVETTGPALALLAQAEIQVSFPGPTTSRYSVRAASGAVSLERSEKTSLGWVPAKTNARAAARTVLELSVPLSELRPGPGRELAFRLALVSQGVEIERHPDIAPIRFDIEEVARDAES